MTYAEAVLLFEMWYRDTAEFKEALSVLRRAEPVMSAVEATQISYDDCCGELFISEPQSRFCLLKAVESFRAALAFRSAK